MEYKTEVTNSLSRSTGYALVNL